MQFKKHDHIRCTYSARRKIETIKMESDYDKQSKSWNILDEIVSTDHLISSSENLNIDIRDHIFIMTDKITIYVCPNNMQGERKQ